MKEQGEILSEKQMEVSSKLKKKRLNPDNHHQAHKCRRNLRLMSTASITSLTDIGANTAWKVMDGNEHMQPAEASRAASHSYHLITCS